MGNRSVLTREIGPKCISNINLAFNGEYQNAEFVTKIIAATHLYWICFLCQKLNYEFISIINLINTVFIYRDDLGNPQALCEETKSHHEAGAQRCHQCSLAGDECGHHDAQEDDDLHPRQTSGRHCLQWQAGLQG